MQCLHLQTWPFEEEDNERFELLNRDSEPTINKVPSAFVLRKEASYDETSEVCGSGFILVY